MNDELIQAIETKKGEDKNKDKKTETKDEEKKEVKPDKKKDKKSILKQLKGMSFEDLTEKVHELLDTK